MDTIIETTPSQITRKQGGGLWIISTRDGLLNLYSQYRETYIPVTVFIRSQGYIQAKVLWMHPAAQYAESEY